MKQWLKNDGIGLAEVMIAAGLMSGIVLTVMKTSQNANNTVKRTYANDSRQQLFALLNRNMGNSNGCMNTLGPAGAGVNSTNATGSVTVPSIKDKDNNVVIANNSKYGEITVKNITYSNYAAGTGSGTVTVRGTYKMDKKNVEMKPVQLVINSNFDTGAAAPMTACSSSGDENFWLAMTSPDLGIFYAGGAVMIGTGIATNGTTDPLFAMGEGNNVQSAGATALGQNNIVDTSSVYSTAVGGNNSISGVYSFAAGYNNAVRISTGSVGGSGPLSSVGVGYGNVVTGSEAHAYGTGNAVIERFGMALGVNNNVGGISGIALGVNNVVSASNGLALGTYSEANASRAVSIGTYVKSSAVGAMTLGDNSLSTYSVNSRTNSFKSRFDGGFTFHSDSSESELTSLFYTDGYLGVNKRVADPVNALQADVGATPKVALQVTGGVTKLAQERWIYPSVITSPVNWSVPRAGQQVAYYKDSVGMVHLRGQPQATSAMVCTVSTVLFTLPAGYRPATNLSFFQPGVEPGTSTSTLLYETTIQIGGQVVIFGYCGMGTAWSQLTGISFRAEM